MLEKGDPIVEKRQGTFDEWKLVIDLLSLKEKPPPRGFRPVHKLSIR